MPKKCTTLWREARFQVNMYKTHHVRTCSDHFLKLRCRKSARRCGAKHISKSKMHKHSMLPPLLEVEMSKKCTPLWREARFQVESAKKPTGSDMFGPLLEVEMSKKCTQLWRDFISQSKCTKHSMLGPLLEVEMSKKRTLLWREARFQVESVKTRRVRSSFGLSDVIVRDMRKGFSCCQK